MTRLRRIARRGINAALSVGGLELVRRGERAAGQGFIPLQETLAGARRAGLSVGDFVDREYNVAGATQAAVDQLEALGVFEGVDRVCEIGPGSGRYLEKILRLCEPSHYEIYETSREWSDWLASRYPILAHPSNGRTLDSTPSASIDLVQAHKVFVYVPSLVTLGYFREMARVVRAGGRLVFDLVTEKCIDEDTASAWIDAGISYPILMARQYAIDFFQTRGFTLSGSFFVPMRPGRSECFAFTKSTT